jgi:methionyl aminopeptidase
MGFTHKNTVIYKTTEEINLIRQSADLLGRTHGEVAKMIKPGVKTIELDKRAEEFITDNGGIPSFKNFDGKVKTLFPGSLCISVNETVVHGFPSEYALKEGDIVSIDCGVILNGFHSDSAYTYGVGEISQEKRNLLLATKEALYLGITQMIPNNRIGDISYAIQNYVEKKGYSVVRELVGHGIGRNLHEAPEVPNFGKKGIGSPIKDGLVIAIEPMVNMGKKDVSQLSDEWTIITKDKKPSAHFEHTVAFYDGKPEILTTFAYIDLVYTI